MNNILENPSAFLFSGTMGMTLRDYFAARAMEACITNSSSMAALSQHLTTAKEIRDRIAETSYKQADAMLAMRSK